MISGLSVKLHKGVSWFPKSIFMYFIFHNQECLQNSVLYTNSLITKIWTIEGTKYFILADDFAFFLILVF